MAKWTLGELINLDSLKVMFENLSEAFGVSLAVLDKDGEKILESGIHDICSKLHKSTDHSLNKCKQSAVLAVKQLKSDTNLIYKCQNNLWHIAVPIVVENDNIGILVLGKFFYEDEKIDIELFKKQAKKNKYNEEEYLKYINNLPRLSKERVEKMLQCSKVVIDKLVEEKKTRLEYIRSDEKLRKNQEKYSKFFSSIRDLIFIIDADRKFTEYYYPSDAELYLIPEEILGKRVDEVLPKGMTELIELSIRNIEEKRTDEPYEYPLNSKGKEIWYSFQISKVTPDSNEAPCSYIAVVRDITERKLIEAELIKAKIQAEDANKTQGIFVANVSHELRTPITVIQSTIQLLEMNLMKKSNENGIIDDKYIKIMKQNCQRLQKITNNLIDVTKIDSGFMSINPRNMDIVSVVNNITESVSQYAAEKGINLQFNTNVKKRVMAIDFDMIERILLNLLSNAVKFTNKDGTIFINLEDFQKYITISVKDTGIGIPKEKIEYIFDRFYQIDNSFSRNHEGSGIGLSLVKSFVEMHDGSVSVTSEQGKGSNFIIKLPIKMLKNERRKSVDFQTTNLLTVEFSDIYKD